MNIKNPDISATITQIYYVYPKVGTVIAAVLLESWTGAVVFWLPPPPVDPPDPQVGVHILLQQTSWAYTIFEYSHSFFFGSHISPILLFLGPGLGVGCYGGNLGGQVSVLYTQ